MSIVGRRLNKLIVVFVQKSSGSRESNFLLLNVLAASMMLSFYFSPLGTILIIRSRMCLPTHDASILSTILSIAMDRVEGVVGVCGALPSADLIVGGRRGWS